MTNRKSFIIHIDSLNILDDLTDDQAGILFKAIRAYQLGEELELDALTKIAFSPFKNQFVRDEEKYKKLCEKNRKIAENRYKKKDTKSTTGKNGDQPKPDDTKSTDNDSDSKSDSKNKSDSDSKSNKETNTVNKSNEPFEIFTYWKKVMKKSEASKFGAKRLKAVKARLAEGYTVDQIKQAIFGCSVTPHNMGKNANGKVYDCLELICRSGENVERFAGNAQQIAPQKYSVITSNNISNIQDLELE